MNFTPPPFAPSISVIISVYNTEKYIGACLESILGQTFQIFEVIAVNNGSTDNSPAILESYVPKFGGRLKILNIEINSGGPSPAWNKAILLSRGKYVYIMDSDDLIVSGTLEILYNSAEQFEAEVVNMGRVLEFGKNAEKPFPEKEDLSIRSWQLDNLANEPKFESDKLDERISNFCSGKITVTAWSKLIRRDFLIENEITFPNDISAGADFIFSIELICLAKKFLQIPHPLYIYRLSTNSATRNNNTSSTRNNKTIVNGLKFLNNFLSKQKFLKENPQYQLSLLEYFHFKHFTLEGYLELPLPQAYDELKTYLEEVWGKEENLTAYFCIESNFLRIQNLMMFRYAAELENKLKQLQGG